LIGDRINWLIRAAHKPLRIGGFQRGAAMTIDLKLFVFNTLSDRMVPAVQGMTTRR
jgi:hypothetical protein